MRRPNVIVILADDLGYSDIGAFGGEIDTPHLDALADDGVRMSQFYVNPRCSPTRASLLTGRYAHEVGIGLLTTDDRPFGYDGDLNSKQTTVAEALLEDGYRTCLAGKWHLSSDTRTPSESWPTRRGFESVFGIIRGATSYFQPKTLVRGEKNVEDEAFADSFYLTDAIADHAVEFVRDEPNEGRPFFLYLSFTAPHWPLQARAEDIARYRGMYSRGWEATRQARYERLLSIGLLAESTSLSNADCQDDQWDDRVIDTSWEARRMEVYAAQVTAMDSAIGRVLDALRETGQENDTLVVFLSDNGACAEDLPLSLDGAPVLKPDTCPPKDRAGNTVLIGNSPLIVPGGEATYASYGRRWANVSNTPFRMYKRWVHEGGIAAPLIARWPAGGVSGGQIDARTAHVIDILPTILVATDSPRPPDSHASLPFEGLNLLEGWRGSGRSLNRAADPEGRPIYWEHMGNAAVRKGRWKLVRELDLPWELYDVQEDRSETINLARKLPAVVEGLRQLWEDWSKRVGVIPWSQIVSGYQGRGKGPPDG